MAKWMDEKFIAGISNKLREGLTDEIKSLGNEYQTLKMSELPNFIKKVYDYFPKASKSDVLAIGMLDPMISLIYENVANLEGDEKAAYEKKYFDRIKVCSNLPEDVELTGILAIGYTPMCVSNFKKGKDAYEFDATTQETTDKEETTEKTVGNSISDAAAAATSTTEVNK